MWRKVLATLTLTALLVPFASRASAGPSDDFGEVGAEYILPSGHVVLGGRSGATEACNGDGDRKIAVDWLDPGAGATGLPLHIMMSGAGGNYANIYVFEFWTAIPTPITVLTGRDNVPGAFNIIIRFECMNSPSYPANIAPGVPNRLTYLDDLRFNPLDVNYVYELLCTNNFAGTADHVALQSINRDWINCSKVGLSGVSGGGFTSIMLLNDCFDDLTIAGNIKAVATNTGGFFPVSVCPTPGRINRTSYTLSTGTPLFMKVACDDTMVPFQQLVAPNWERAAPPKYLYSRQNGHPEVDPVSDFLYNFVFGEDLIKAFMRYYLLGDSGASGLGALDDYPDRADTLRVSNPSFRTSYQYQSEIGTNLSGGLCRETFARWSAPTWDNGDAYLEHLKSVVEESAEELPNTN